MKHSDRGKPAMEQVAEQRFGKLMRTADAMRRTPGQQEPPRAGNFERGRDAMLDAMLEAGRGKPQRDD
jgi:hypothetical protein